MANAWRAHIKKTMQENPKLMLKDVLRLASKTYKKVKGVAKSVVPAAPKRKRRRTAKRKMSKRGKKTKGMKKRSRVSKRRRTRRRRKTKKRR